VFSAEWLSLREPADRAARSTLLTRALADVLPDTGPVAILDLASGTGANARYLCERLRHEQDWLLTDHDAALLSAVPGQLVSADGRACKIVTRFVDLSVLDDGLFDNRQLVTASALLDLVSESWIQRLAQHCRRSRAVVLFALTYNGRIGCDPEESEDRMIRELVNRHQRTDKGFGPALGPSAPAVAERVFADAGYAVRRAPSDWLLKPDMHELQRQLIEGWASAAREIDSSRRPVIDGWLSRRLSLIERGTSRITVGHDDLLAVPRD
jgi:hypothetical protein